MRTRTSCVAAALVLALVPRAALAEPDDAAPTTPSSEPPSYEPPSYEPPSYEPPAPTAAEDPPPPPRPAPEPVPPPAPPRAPRFGERGQTFVTNELALDGALTRYDDLQGEVASFRVRVAAMHFVLPNLAVGGSAGLESSSRRVPRNTAYDVTYTTTVTRWGGQLAVAYDVPLTGLSSLLPSVAVGMESVMSQNVDYNRMESWLVPRVRAFVPLVVHPRRGFFVGLGPSIDHTFDGRLDENAAPETTRVAVESVFGAYLDSAREAEAEEPRVRFGRARDLVMTSETSAALSYQSNARDDARSTALSLTPSVDYFLIDHFSLGLGARAVYSRRSTDAVNATLDPRTRPQREESATRLTFGGVVRLGAALPLGSFVSWFPRVGFGVDHRHLRDTVGDATYLRGQTWVPYVSVDAPLVAHAGRGLVGVGPSFSRDLEPQPVHPFRRDVPNVRFGVSAIVGGWL